MSRVIEFSLPFSAFFEKNREEPKSFLRVSLAKERQKQSIKSRSIRVLGKIYLQFYEFSKARSEPVLCNVLVL